MKKIVAITLLVTTSAAHAQYIRVGPMKATVCTGVVLKSCGQKEISAIEQRGNFFEPSESFGSVDSFSGKTCTIRTSSDNVVTAAAMAAKLPSFYTLEGGRQVKIKPDYVQFSCYKR
jgi:hypothetical protein